MMQYRVQLMVVKPVIPGIPTFPGRKVETRVLTTEELVELLPKTADGVPIVPGMIVYFPHGPDSPLVDAREVLSFAGPQALNVRDPSLDRSGQWMQSGNYYASQEAALAAMAAAAQG